jgi:PKD repeat protein
MKNLKFIILPLIILFVISTVKAQFLPPCGFNPTFSTSISANTGTFTNTTALAPASAIYYWNFGDGSVATGPNQVHTYANTGVYIVCMYIYNVDSTTNIACTDTICNSVSITSTSGPCSASFIDSAGAGINNVIFYNTSTSPNSFTSYWDFGDGNTSTLTNPVHTYANSGTYMVCLYIFDSIANCADTICYPIIVGTTSCNASFSTSYINNTLIQFTNLSTAPSAFTSMWYFGDGNTSTLTNPTHAYANTGIYTVCLVIMGGGCIDSFCFPVTAYGTSAGCNANFVSSPFGNTVVFNNISTTNGGAFFTSTWDFGDGNTSNSTNPTHTYASPGTYTVCLYIWDSINNCADTFCNTIIIGTSTGCSASFIDSTAGNIGLFYNTSTSSNSFTSYWDFGDGNTSTLTNPVHTYANAGTYMVCLYIYDSIANCADTICYPIIVGTTSCNAMFSTSYINNTLIQFTNLSTAPSAFTSMWYFGDGNTSTLTNPTHAYANTGIYTVCLVIMGGGCVDSFCMPVTAYANVLCDANYTTSITNNVATFTNTSTGSGLSYLWWFGDGFTSNLASPTHTYAANGVYSVCLVITDSNNTCVDSMCTLVTVTATSGNPCDAQFTVSVSGCNAILTNTSTGSYNSGLWILGNGSTQILTSSTNVVTASYIANGLYTACLFIADTIGLCADTICVPIVIFACANGINDLNNNLSINAYPNPTTANTHLSILSTQSDNISVLITDMMGRELYTTKMNTFRGENTIELPTKNYSSGQYLIKIRDSKNMLQVMKIIKQ